MTQTPRLLTALLACAGLAGAVQAQTGSATTPYPERRDPPVGHVPAQDVTKAQRQIDEAVQVVQRMKREDPAMAETLRKAHGVFILTRYGRGGLGVGVQFGEGVLVTRQGDEFSNPVFYDLGGASVGAQAGAAGGEMALLLMSERAVRDFRSGENFALNADASLTIGPYSKRAQASAGQVHDVVVWSGTAGAYVGASLGAAEVAFDDYDNRAYYGVQNLTPEKILRGEVANPRHNVLGMVLGV